ncbi:MAG: aspartate-semialdehyde dehydrogenase [Rickettsiales bacterium]|nr:aspartate-semialdehyde dehydrogenase [Rickettsiales bacterium]
MSKEAGYCVAVVGATGLVGREIVRILEERSFPVGSLRLFASERSAGEQLDYCGRKYIVEALGDEAPAGIDIALFSAGSSLSRKMAPRFAAAGAVVIDNSSAWRMEKGVPLVVPEVNPQAVFEVADGGGIIANPNCSTIQLVVALKPLVDAFGVERVVVSTYQSVSGAGQAAMEELSQQVVALFSSQEPVAEAMAHPIAFNCIPGIGQALDNGYTEEEWKLVQESRKILELPTLSVSPTAVRVPVFSCHAESVNVTCSRTVSAVQARAALSGGEGIVVQDRLAEDLYPMGRELTGSDEVYVGRIRQDPDREDTINFWIVADNLRKGAALNAVQIAEVFDEGPEE